MSIGRIPPEIPIRLIGRQMASGIVDRESAYSPFHSIVFLDTRMGRVMLQQRTASRTAASSICWIATVKPSFCRNADNTLWGAVIPCRRALFWLHLSFPGTTDILTISTVDLLRRTVATTGRAVCAFVDYRSLSLTLTARMGKIVDHQLFL